MRPPGPLSEPTISPDNPQAFCSCPLAGTQLPALRVPSHPHGQVFDVVTNSIPHLALANQLDLVDLKEDNVLVNLESEAVLEAFVQLHRQIPMPRHVADDGHVTYLSQSGFGPLHNYSVLPEIADFDLAQSGEGPIRIHPAQTHRYRAPEVIFGTGWSYSADIWNFGVLVMCPLFFVFTCHVFVSQL